MVIPRWLRGKRPRDEVVESYPLPPQEGVVTAQAREDSTRALEQLGKEYAFELQRMLRFTFNLDVLVEFQGIKKVGPNKEVSKLILEIVDQDNRDLLQSIQQGAEARILRLGVPNFVQVHFRYRRVA